jgi:hypothetical protein
MEEILNVTHGRMNIVGLVVGKDEFSLDRHDVFVVEMIL